jgi:hypothetical protein
MGEEKGGGKYADFPDKADCAEERIIYSNSKREYRRKSNNPRTE